MMSRSGRFLHGLHSFGRTHLRGRRGWEALLGISFGRAHTDARASWYFSVLFGWGYDYDVPLRPWPQAVRSRTVRYNAPSLTLAWLGFLANFSWSDAETSRSPV